MVVSPAPDSGCVPQTIATQHVHLPHSPASAVATANTSRLLRGATGLHRVLILWSIKYHSPNLQIN